MPRAQSNRSTIFHGAQLSGDCEGVHFRDPSGLQELVNKERKLGARVVEESVFLDTPFEDAMMFVYKVRVRSITTPRSSAMHLPRKLAALCCSCFAQRITASEVARIGTKCVYKLAPPRLQRLHTGNLCAQTSVVLLRMQA